MIELASKNYTVVKVHVTEKVAVGEPYAITPWLYGFPIISEEPNRDVSFIIEAERIVVDIEPSYILPGDKIYYNIDTGLAQTYIFEGENGIELGVAVSEETFTDGQVVVSFSGKQAQFDITSLIPNMVFFGDASDAGSISASGNLVNSWSSQYGLPAIAQKQLDHDRPETGTDTINGFNAIKWEGVTDADVNLKISSISPAFSNNTGCAIIVVSKFIDYVGAKAIAEAFSTRLIFGQSGYPSNMSIFFNNADRILYANPEAGTPHIMAARFWGNQCFKNQLYIDGRLTGEATGSTTYSGTNNVILGNDNSLGNSIRGSFSAFILMYGICDDSLAFLIGFLANKFKLWSVLSWVHPYRYKLQPFTGKQLLLPVNIEGCFGWYNREHYESPNGKITLVSGDVSAFYNSVNIYTLPLTQGTVSKRPDYDTNRRRLSLSTNSVSLFNTNSSAINFYFKNKSFSFFCECETSNTPASASSFRLFNVLAGTDSKIIFGATQASLYYMVRENYDLQNKPLVKPANRVVLRGMTYNHETLQISLYDGDIKVGTYTVGEVLTSNLTELYMFGGRFSSALLANVGSCFLFDRVLDETNGIKELQGFSAWGPSLWYDLLDAGHPYKNNPPMRN